MNRTRFAHHRGVAFLVLALAMVVPVLGEEPVSSGPRITVGANALSPFSFLVPFPVSSIFPVFTGMEYGPSLFVGIASGETGEWQARLCFGLPNPAEAVTQVQAAWRWFPFASGPKAPNGFHVGPALRLWDQANLLTGTQRFNALALVDVGWQFVWGSFVLDLRLSQSIAIATASTLPHSYPAAAFFFTPMPGQIPILPWITVDLGWRP